MSHSGGPPEVPAMVLRLSVPASDSYKAVAKDLAAKIAEFLGTSAPDAQRVGAVLDRLASTVAPETVNEDHDHDQDKDITFEFRHADHELLIEARCAGRSSEARHRLPQ